MSETNLDVQSTLADIRARAIDLAEKAKGYEEKNIVMWLREDVFLETQELLRLACSSSPDIGRAAAYALVSASTQLNLGLDPSKNPADLTEEENEKFYQGATEFFKAADVFCLINLSGRATDQDIKESRIVEITLEAWRTFLFTINGKKIVLNSTEVNKDDVKIFCSGGDKRISEEFTGAAVGNDRMFSAKVDFEIPYEYMEDKNKVFITAFSPGFYTNWRSITLKYE